MDVSPVSTKELDFFAPDKLSVFGLAAFGCEEECGADLVFDVNLGCDADILSRYIQTRHTTLASLVSSTSTVKGNTSSLATASSLITSK